MTFKHSLCALASVVLLTAVASPYSSPGAPFATDAYPGFDSESSILPTPRKELGFFSWWTGPKMSTASEQLAWAASCEADGSIGKARRAYDALVAAWPSSPEAPKAQQALAELEYGKELDYIQAFEEYKYLLDYYSVQCDYDAIVTRLYEAACQMRVEGKRICFFRFANTTDVRRAFEAVVRRAPGAAFAPAAMLAVAELREEEDCDEQAVEVYETLRSQYPESEEARRALRGEATARMRLLHEFGYNQKRCKDTIAFLKMAQTMRPEPGLKADLVRWYEEAVAMLEDEAFKAAMFYDSRTRTRRSAISACERYLIDYPASSHVEAVRARLLELREEAK